MEVRNHTPSLEDAGELSGIEVLHPGGFDLSKRIGEVVDLRGRNVLEVGCGRGAYSCYFARHYGGRITGVDLSADMIRSSTSRAIAEGVAASTEFRVADASSLPFANNSFDVVISECGPVGLAPIPQRVVDEMARVLKLGGTLVLHAPVWLREVPDKERREVEHRLGGRMFAPSEWKNMLENAGLAGFWEEDWSGMEQIRKIRPGRRIETLGDVFTLREKILVVLPGILKRFGVKGLIYLGESFRKVTPLFGNGTIGTRLMRVWRPAADTRPTS